MSDTDQLLAKLATIRCPLELNGFSYGLTAYRKSPPPQEVINAIAHKKIELQSAPRRRN